MSTARKRRDTRGSIAEFREALGLTETSDNGAWTKVQADTLLILTRRGLIGQVPSSIKDLPIKKVIAEQLEALNPELFGRVRPSSARKGLLNKILAYEMSKHRVTSLRRTGGVGASVRSTVEVSAAEASVAEASAAEESEAESKPQQQPASVTQQQASRSPQAEPLPTPQKQSLTMPPQQPSGDVSVKGNSPKESVAGSGGTAGFGLIPKETVVTVVAPSIPGFQAQFVRNDLLVDGVPSMARFFEILEEDGYRGVGGGGKEDVIVRDECGIRLQSSRHLNVTFQKLANEEKLASKWYVLKKGEMDGTLARSAAITPASLLGQWGQTAMSEYYSGEENVSYSAFGGGTFGAAAANDIVMEDRCQQHPPSSSSPNHNPVVSESSVTPGQLEDGVREAVAHPQVGATAAANDGDKLPTTTTLAAVENHHLEFDMWADDGSSLSSVPPSPPTLA